MTPLSLPDDDLPPNAITDLDVVIRRHLEISTGQYFFEACSGPIQSLLIECGWTINVLDGLMLVIYCPDSITNWRVLGQLAAIAEPLSRFSPLAKIRVYPPAGTGGPFDMRVDERSEFRDGPKPIQ